MNIVIIKIVNISMDGMYCSPNVNLIIDSEFKTISITSPESDGILVCSKNQGFLDTQRTSHKMGVIS